MTTQKVTVTIERDVITKIRAQAIKEGRSISNMVQRLVKIALGLARGEEHGRDKPIREKLARVIMQATE